MLMALIWNDMQSFKQHLEHMRMFRQTHDSDEGRLAPLKNVPTHPNIHPSSKAGFVKGCISIKGGAALAPIWEITPPRNSQN